MKTLRVLVAGMVVADPNHGGATWAVIQYALGLQALGHTVELVDPVTNPSDPTQRYRRTVVATFGLPVALGYPQGREHDVLLNLSGRLPLDRLGTPVPIRVYVDLDPVFTQLWHLDGIDVGLDGHTHFASVGSRVPDTGHNWLPILPLVSLEHWPDRSGTPPRSDAFTTVANWRGYGSIERDGVHYGQKAHSLRPLLGLPRTVPEPIELALSIHAGETADLGRLTDNCWSLIEPSQVAGSPNAYRRFVSGSRAEFGLAKSGYILSRSGWFSDRSACYLASGRPVIAHDTGFGDRLPTGAGLHAFTSMGEFADAAGSLRFDYSRHARAARAIAEEFLDARQILGDLLREVGATSGRTVRRLHSARDEELVEVLSAPVIGRRPSPYRSAAPLLEVDVGTDAGVQELMLKDVSPAGWSQTARRAKPAFLDDALREVVVYRQLLAGAGLDTPELRTVVADDRRWLALERVHGVPLEQVGDLEVWKSAFSWLARLHDRFHGRTLPARLLRYDADLLLRLGGHVALGKPSVVEAATRLGAIPPTLVHGDLFPANVLVGGSRICVIDWELAGSGAGALDVASLSTGWPEEMQEELVDAYRLALDEPPPPRTTASQVADARLVLASRFAALLETWKPPAEHAHDFAADLGRLGVPR